MGKKISCELEVTKEMETCCQKHIGRWIADWLNRKKGKYIIEMIAALVPFPKPLLSNELTVLPVVLSPESNCFPLQGHLATEQNCVSCGTPLSCVLLDARLMLIVYYSFAQIALLRENSTNSYRPLSLKEVEQRDRLLATYNGRAEFVDGALNKISEDLLSDLKEHNWSLKCVQLFHHWSLYHELFHLMPESLEAPTTRELMRQVVPTTEQLVYYYSVHPDTALKWIRELRADLSAALVLSNVSSDHIDGRMKTDFRSSSYFSHINVFDAAWLGLELLLLINPMRRHLEDKGTFYRAEFADHPPLTLRRDLIGSLSIKLESASVGVGDPRGVFTQMAIARQTPPPLLARHIKPGVEKLYA